MGRNKQSKLKTLHDLRYKYRCLLKWNQFRPFYKNHILSIWVHYLNDWIITIVMLAHPQNGSIQNGKNRIHRGLLIKINVFKDFFLFCSTMQSFNYSLLQHLFSPPKSLLMFKHFYRWQQCVKKPLPGTFQQTKVYGCKPIVRLQSIFFDQVIFFCSQ